MLAVSVGYTQTPNRSSKDTTRTTKDARKRLYARWNDRLGNRLNYKSPRSSLFPKDPKNINTDVKMTPDKTFNVNEKLGDSKTPTLNYRNPSNMTYEQFQKLQNDRVMGSLLRDYSAKQDGKGALGGRGLLPRLDLPPSLDRIFGSNIADIRPNGFVLLDFGIRQQRIDNPLTPIFQRNSTNFFFDQQININLNGKIGGTPAIPGIPAIPGAPNLSGLNILTNFDTKASFNFENQFKINYKPEEQSLIQGIQAGNINWQLPTQLITGVQNLRGLKADLKFGRLGVSLIASQQISKQQCITLRGGVQNRAFEIKADAYEENRNFFLSQYFRDNYERWLKNLPMITSNMIVTRVEVYVTNRSNNTETLRNLAAFADMGEAKPFGTTIRPVTVPVNSPVDNANNALYLTLTKDPKIRQVDITASTIEGYGLRRGTNFDILKGARRLRETEFRFHPQLGYISLLTQLRNDEVLAVSYEYSLNGQAYKVGELTEDYQSRREDEMLVLKLLKASTSRNDTSNPMWNLMMKNVYSLNTTQIAKQGFQMRVIYKDDLSGLDNPSLQQGERLANKPLLRVMHLDRLNALGDPQPDGNFDYVEGTTIDSRFGKIIFPVLEPFGQTLENEFLPTEETLKAKYVFSELYRTTQIDAQQITEKNKFFLKGSFQGATGGGAVQLPFGVTPQSVTVRAAGTQLQAGSDYIVDAQIGQVRIINESVANSGRDIEVCYEQPDLFQNQTRTTLGSRLEYTVSPDLKIGGTVMRLRETPAGFITRTAIGNEPANNTMIGADVRWRKESQFLTKMIDALPLLQTKEKSSIQFQGEVAKLYSGISPQARDRSFIDDFEAARTPFDYTRQPNRWRLGSTPQPFEGGSESGLKFAYKRARMSAYSIDNTFYGTGIGSFQPPKNITDDGLTNFYETFFRPQDIFTGRSVAVVNLPVATFDLSYFPSERGMYNFNPNLDANGRLSNPEQNYGALTRAISSDPDFDNANIENIEFWLLDPFITDPKNGVVRDGFENAINNTGGKLLIQLGEVSEDVMKNGRSDFENGLPIDEKKIGENIVETTWGNTTRQQNIINAFDNRQDSRAKQDVGLDGLSNEEEKTFFKNYLDQVSKNVKLPAALEAIKNDPAGDDYKYYFSDEADTKNEKLIERYKYSVGMENNSPITAANNSLLIPASTILPDAEDLNIDNTINDVEQYFEYEVPLKPNGAVVGEGYVVDRVNAKGANWYLFRIPVREFTNKFGGINGFKNLRFMRLVMTGWKQPVVLRFAQFQMVGLQYRKYNNDLNTKGLQQVPEPYDAQFVVSTVSAEENSSNTSGGAAKNVYDSPPGFDRDRDFTQTNFIQLNEQSMSMCVTNLRDGDSRAAFKNVNVNLLLRKRLRMFVHLHNDIDESGQTAAFLRLGTDASENYYEIEVDSLRATPKSTSDRREIWPLQNEIDIAFDDIIKVKSERDKQGKSLTAPFTMVIRDEAGRKYRITIVGRPDLSAVMMIMIGARNPRSPDQQAKSFCLWVDELHTSGLENQSATAAIGNLNLKLADFATIQVMGRYSTSGFGGIQQKPADRSRDNAKELSVSANVALDKLLPQKWGWKIPLFINYDTKRNRPQYNPLDPDMPLNTALDNLKDNPAKQAELENIAIEQATRKGFNFSNVRKTKTDPASKKHFWDFENLSFTYAYNEFSRQNSMIADYSQRQYKGGIAYQYSFPQKTWSPFKNVKAFDRPYLELLKDFNLSLLPTIVSIRYEGDRNFTKTLYRGPDLTSDGQIPLFEKFFLFNARYDLSWNLTKNLVVSYGFAKSSVIDEPYGDLNTQAKKDSLWNNFSRKRTKNFDQNIKFVYRIPFDKIPLLDWVTGDYNHNIRYQYSPTDQSMLQDKNTLDHTGNTIGSLYTPNSFNLRDDRGQLFGNTIRNTKEWGLVGRVDLVKLYNKIKYLNFANRPSQARKNFARSPGDDEDIVREPSRFAKNVTRFLMAVRGLDMSYNEIATTTLNGFLPQQTLTGGINDYNGVFNNSQPMLPFVFGSQNPEFHNLVSARNWVSTSVEINQPFIQTLNKTFRSWANLEPVKDLRIKIEVRRTRGDQYQESYAYDTLSQRFNIQSPVRNGNFEMSFISIKTAFESLGRDNVSATYDKFKNVYRQAALRALNASKTSDKGEYNLNSQDVLLAAFFSAYNGRDSSNIKTNPFLNFPFPNWTVNYGGLSQLAPFKKIFSSFTIEHSYQSTFSVGNFTSSQLYNTAQDRNVLNLSARDYTNAYRYDVSGQLTSPFIFKSGIKITERMSPLIGIRARTKSKIDLAIRYDKARTITLFAASNFLEEIYNRNIQITMGFTRSNLKIPFKINGKYQKLKNDLRFQGDFALLDTRNITRLLDEKNPVIGQNSYINYRINGLVDYTVSKLWSVQVYYSRTFNTPLVSTIFAIPTSSGGVRVRFNVAEL